MTKVNRLTFESVRFIVADNDIIVQEAYQKLTNLVSSYGGRVHGTQHTISHIHGEDESHCFSLVVYFQIPVSDKEEFEREYGS